MNFLHADNQVQLRRIIILQLVIILFLSGALVQGFMVRQELSTRTAERNQMFQQLRAFGTQTQILADERQRLIDKRMDEFERKLNDELIRNVERKR